MTRKTRLLCLLLALTATADAAVICDNQFTVDTSFITYCTNNKTGPAVIVIHGTERNAAEYAGYLADLETLVIAPLFASTGPGLYWPSSSWSSGYQATGPIKISSFDVVDRMMTEFNGNTIIGHSAGGQFVTRYAAGTRLQGVAFIAANAGSYLWLDESRPVAGTCAGYNDYKYGLNKPNAYMSAGLAPDYPMRNVIYLLGALDTAIDSNLDIGCEANLQGANRLERGLNFYQHLTTRYGAEIHRLELVEGIGHNPRKMLQAATQRFLTCVSSSCRTCSGCH